MFTPASRRNPVRTLKLVIALAALCVVALPAVANAATISYDSSGALHYTAGSGEKNYFGTSDDGSGRVQISDSGTNGFISLSEVLCVGLLFF
jgi:hypothetical protein